ncbi:MAG: hypothetical protein BIFFINMI_03638 [Phycisphaerae bacterium]|nr:hypothetical protein [Phycisphaerae bacterium]
MEPFESDPRYRFPRVVQFSVFLDNRVGKLRELLNLFLGTNVQLAALTVVDSADCAIVRCILAPSDEARGMLRSAGMAFSETEMVVAELGSPDALRDLCEVLVSAEVNIHYAYPMLVRQTGQSAVALHVDEPEMAATVLRRKGFSLLGEAEIS